MTEPLQVGQFAIVDHEPVDRGPNAGVFHGKGPTDDRAELFILAEGTTPAGEAFAGHVVSALGQAFNTLDMSLTGSLKKLFEEAERNLLDWNRKSISEHRVRIGLSAFGRRGNQAVIAQAGPSAIFHLHNGVVESHFTNEEHGRPIGAGPLKTQLTRVAFDPGDRLLIVSTSALREVDDEVMAGILALPGPQVLADLFHRVEQVRDLTAILVTSGDPPGLPEPDESFIIDATAALPAPAQAVATAPSPPRETPGKMFQPSLFIGDRAEDVVETARRQLMEVTPRRQMGAAVPAVITEMPTPLLRVAGESPLTRLAAERQARAAMSQAAVANGGSSLLHHTGRRPTSGSSRPTSNEPPSSSTQQPRRRHDRHDSFSRGLVHEEVPARPDPMVETLPLVNDLAAEYRARGATLTPASETIAGEAVATLNNGGSLVRMRGNMGGRWKGNGSSSRRGTVSGQLPPTWLVIAVGLGILLTLVGIITVPRLLSEQSGERYASLIDGAQQRLSTAKVQTDPAARRTALTEAQALLLEAKDAKPNDPDVASLLAQTAQAIGVMDAIKAPAAVDVIGSLDQFGDKPVSVTRLTVGDSQAYLLDNASGQVISMSLDTGDRKVVYAEDKTLKRGRPVATAYLDSGDLGGLALIADASRQLWSYSPTAGVKPVALGAPANLNVTDIATSGRDLYVLDASQSVVYRFTQSNGGFGDAPTKVLETPDLAAARRLMVDSQILTSDANGTLHSFSGQLALQLSQAGIDKKLIADAVPQDVTKDGDLALLDAPNDRVITLKRDGTFAGQFVHKDFHAATAFAIRNGAGYIFSGGELRKITF